MFVASFAPEVFTFADRAFGAGHSYLWRRTLFAPEHQRKMLRRLHREQPHVVLFTLEPWLKQRFELLHVYLHKEYAVVGKDDLGGETLAVALRRRTPGAGVHAETGWPCLR